MKSYTKEQAQALFDGNVEAQRKIAQKWQGKALAHNKEKGYIPTYEFKNDE